ncbi:MAG: Dyp-type peroxidase, partial [Pseudonocardia sp.]|nr:Dyp-type peroxidase [Pseudonocardia sp.]
MEINRRHLLTGAVAGAVGTAAGAGLLAAGAAADNEAARSPNGSTSPVPTEAVPFHGAHQAGILTPTPQQRFTTHAAFDVTAATAAELKDLFVTLTDRARLLTAGGSPPDLGVGSPPADSEVLGPDVPPDGLTVTVSVGASLFDDRYGLANRAPARLTAMRTFPNDALEPPWCHGDLMIAVCAHNPDTVHHALRDIAKHTRGGMQVRYRMDGFVSPPRPSGTPRNLLGFKDGISQPLASDADRVVWVQPGAPEPAWTAGGSYQVVRLIRMLIEFWDRVSLHEQENMFGRRRDSGAPLDGT